ncbi:MAG: glycosyltransferase family 39 protein [Eubacterium sp.]|nr:glycosyltransferase family 39 protein [Eubacterium sp.]
MICQIGLVSYLGAQRAEIKGTHIDEMYSYVLANSYDGSKISTIDSYWDQWIDGNALMETITVQKGEGFSYDKVYYNNSFDCHPPLFYALLHTVCSVFTDQYTIWFGIALNMFLMLIADILIYLLSKEFINNKTAAVLPVLLWGISLACINTVLFIRMYMLLAVCSIGFLYMTVRSLKKGFNLKRCFFLFAFSLLGVFTHYYFILFAFFVTLSYCLYKFFKKNFKEGLLFGSTVALSVVLLLVIYPCAIQQATGSDTNNVGNEVSRSILNFSTLPKKIIDFISWLSASLFSNKYTFAVICVLAFSFVTAMLVEAKIKHKKMIPDNDFKLVISLIVIIMVTIVASLHIAGDYASERYIYNLYPILAVLFVSFFYKIIENLANKKFALIVLSLILLLNAGVYAVNPSCRYMYSSEKTEVEMIVNSNAKNCIVINAKSKEDGKAHQMIPTANVVRFNNFEKIYLTTADSVQDIDSILSGVDCSKGIAVYLATDKYWANGYEPDEIFSQLFEHTDKFNDYQYIENLEFGKLYLLTEQVGAENE